MSWLISNALMRAYENSLSSPEQEVESLEVTSSGGEPSAPLNVMPTPHKFWRNDKTMEPSQLSRFGLTCAVLTEYHGGDLLTWFRLDFLAKTSPSLGGALDSLGFDQGCGPKLSASFARFDRKKFYWKTAQCSLLEGSDEFSQTWPTWGSMRSGESYLRPTAVLYTEEIASGSWPTPVASMSKGSSPGALTRKNGRDRSNDRLDHAIMALHGGQLNPVWVEWLMGWPSGWTDLKPLEMVKFHEWRQQHSPSLANREKHDNNASMASPGPQA